VAVTMETTEKIVEAYVRYVKGWATIPNIKCPGQCEIDILAIDPVTSERYQIEVSISISGSFSKLTNTPFDRELAKVRVQQPTQRRTLGFFVQKKFGDVGVLETLAKYGFQPGNYERVIATYGWTLDAKKAAEQQGIILWDFRQIMREMAAALRTEKAYLKDDTMRTLHLFVHAMKDKNIAVRQGQ
jgi:hypothetical protein